MASWGMVRVSGSCAADRHDLRAQRAAAAWEADGGARAAASAGANGVGGELADVVNGARANACDHCAVGGGGADPMYEELNCADSADGGGDSDEAGAASAAARKAVGEVLRMAAQRLRPPVVSTPKTVACVHAWPQRWPSAARR